MRLSPAIRGSGGGENFRRRRSSALRLSIGHVLENVRAAPGYLLAGDDAIIVGVDGFALMTQWL
jgi:hypothetical protein